MKNNRMDSNHINYLKRLGGALAAVVLAFTLASVSASAQNFSTVKSVVDTNLERKIFNEIRNLPRYSVFDHITFQLNGGTVILGGRTNSLGTKRDAGSFVKLIEGVTGVVNNIEELPPSPYDDRIRREALRKLGDAGLYHYLSERDPSVRIIVDGGRVTLEGYVAHRGDSRTFNILANGISGVFSVTNNLIVSRDGAAR